MSVPGSGGRSGAAGEARVAILLATYNGERFLRRQLESIAGQSHQDWFLVVSDDGSSDATLAIIDAFAHEVGVERVIVRDGPRRGFVANFLSMACAPEVVADYFAFCDQDDVWLPEKLERAISRLRAAPRGDHPARLYGGRTLLVDEHDRELGLSRLCSRRIGFENALVQSYAGANTMVFDAAARALLAAAGADVRVASHDWWLYLLVSGVGGAVVYDSHPTVRYRQHVHNAQGANNGVLARFKRLRGLLAGQLRNWNGQHLESLSRVGSMLTRRNRALAEAFSSLRGAGGLAAVRQLRKVGVHRQSTSDDLALRLAALLRRL